MVLVPKAIRMRTASGWQDVAIQGAPGAQGPGGLITAMKIAGSYEGYAGPYTAGGGEIQIYCDAGSTVPLRITYTPPIDAWMDATMQMGLVGKNDAAYAYMIGGMRLTPNDADGHGQASHYVTQHNSVNQYEGRMVRRLYKLAAGVAYTLNGFTGVGTGSWSHYQGPGQLWMDARIYARGVGPTSIIPLVATLPPTPLDGQEVYYLADATNGVIWPLRYRAGSASAYKWEAIGPAALISEVLTQESWAPGGYVNVATVGPAVTVPLAGQYDLDFSAEIASNNVEYLYATPKLGVAAANDNDAAKFYQGVAGSNTRTSRSIRRTLAANDQVLLQYKRGTAASGVATVLLRNLAVKPVRVG